MKNIFLFGDTRRSSIGRIEKSDALFDENLPSSVSFGMAEKRFRLASVTKLCITSAILAGYAGKLLKV